MISLELIDSLEACFRRGLRLVPLGLNGGAPQVHKGMKQDQVVATSLQEAQEKWIYGEACAYGVICGQGVIAIDVDLDIDGAQANFDQHSFPDTFRVNTPNGFHLYFSVPPEKEFYSNHGSWFGAGVEVKGTNGRITGAGSTTSKGKYEPANKLPFTPAPDWLIKKAERVKTEPAVRGEPYFARAMDYVYNAPKAIEGQGGDAQTFTIAQELIRHNLSRPQIEDLMEYYNKKKCIPMWDEEGLKQKIDAAFNSSDYTESYNFDDDFRPEIKKNFEIEKLWTPEDLDNIPPPDYVLDGRLHRGSVNFMIGDPNSGKTLLVVDWAFSLAKEGKRTLCLIGEAPDDFAARLRAWKKHYRFQTYPKGLFFLPHVVFPTMDDPEILDKIIAKRMGEFDLIVIDTFERFIDTRKLNDSDDMASVIKKLEALAKNCNAAVLCVHHLPRGEDRMKGSNTLDTRASIISLVKQTSPTEIKLSLIKNRVGRKDKVWKYNTIFVPMPPPDREGVVAVLASKDDTFDPDAIDPIKPQKVEIKNDDENIF